MEAMYSVIVCCRSSNWQSVIKRELGRSLPEAQLVTATDLDSAVQGVTEFQLRGEPVVLLVELQPRSVDVDAAQIWGATQHWSTAAVFAVGAAELGPWSSLLRCCGLIDYCLLPHQFSTLIPAIEKFFQLYPAVRSIEEQVWRRLPWKRRAVSLR